MGCCWSPGVKPVALTAEHQKNRWFESSSGYYDIFRIETEEQRALFFSGLSPAFGTGHTKSIARAAAAFRLVGNTVKRLMITGGQPRYHFGGHRGAGLPNRFLRSQSSRRSGGLHFVVGLVCHHEFFEWSGARVQRGDFIDISIPRGVASNLQIQATNAALSLANYVDWSNSGQGLGTKPPDVVANEFSFDWTSLGVDYQVDTEILRGEGAYSLQFAVGLRAPINAWFNGESGHTVSVMFFADEDLSLDPNVDQYDEYYVTDELPLTFPRLYNQFVQTVHWKKRSQVPQVYYETERPPASVREFLQVWNKDIVLTRETELAAGPLYVTLSEDASADLERLLLREFRPVQEYSPPDDFHETQIGGANYPALSDWYNDLLMTEHGIGDESSDEVGFAPPLFHAARRQRPRIREFMFTYRVPKSIAHGDDVEWFAVNRTLDGMEARVYNHGDDLQVFVMKPRPEVYEQMPAANHFRHSDEHGDIGFVWEPQHERKAGYLWSEYPASFNFLFAEEPYVTHLENEFASGTLWFRRDELKVHTVKNGAHVAVDPPSGIWHAIFLMPQNSTRADFINGEWCHVLFVEPLCWSLDNALFERPTQNWFPVPTHVYEALFDGREYSAVLRASTPTVSHLFAYGAAGLAYSYTRMLCRDIEPYAASEKMWSSDTSWRMTSYPFDWHNNQYLNEYTGGNSSRRTIQDGDTATNGVKLYSSILEFKTLRSERR